MYVALPNDSGRRSIICYLFNGILNTHRNILDGYRLTGYQGHDGNLRAVFISKIQTLIVARINFV